MKNKSGQFFAIYLVLLTLFMCGIVIGLYYIQQKNIASSIVSPSPLLKLQDDQEIFEMREKELILDSAEKFKSHWNDKDFFKENFRKDFLKSLMEDRIVIDFLSRDLIVHGNSAQLDEENKESFFENILYPDDSFNWNSDGNLEIFRRKIGKLFILKSKEKNKINFPVYVRYEFERKYLLRYENNKFKLEVLE